MKRASGKALKNILISPSRFNVSISVQFHLPNNNEGKSLADFQLWKKSTKNIRNLIKYFYLQLGRTCQGRRRRYRPCCQCPPHPPSSHPQPAAINIQLLNHSKSNYQNQKKKKNIEDFREKNVKYSYNKTHIFIRREK